MFPSISRRAVPPVMNSYEQELSQGQSKKQNWLRPSNIEGVGQKASKPAGLLGRAVPPTTSTVTNIYEKNLIRRGTVPPYILEKDREKKRNEQIVLGGTGTVTLSQTQKILPKQETEESNVSGTVVRSAKFKSNYFQTIENLENLENSSNSSKNGSKCVKSSSKISSTTRKTVRPSSMVLGINGIALGCPEFKI
jgi:hypothetical protein